MIQPLMIIISTITISTTLLMALYSFNANHREQFFIEPVAVHVPAPTLGHIDIQLINIYYEKSCQLQNCYVCNGKDKRVDVDSFQWWTNCMKQVADPTNYSAHIDLFAEQPVATLLAQGVDVPIPRHLVPKWSGTAIQQRQSLTRLRDDTIYDNLLNTTYHMIHLNPGIDWTPLNQTITAMQQSNHMTLTRHQPVPPRYQFRLAGGHYNATIRTVIRPTLTIKMFAIVRQHQHIINLFDDATEAAYYLDEYV